MKASEVYIQNSGVNLREMKFTVDEDGRALAVPGEIDMKNAESVGAKTINKLIEWRY